MAAGFNSEIIQLPVSSIKDVPLSMDIGGSLAKIVNVANAKDTNGVKDVKLELLTFDTADLDSCLDYMKTAAIHSKNPKHIKAKATGVGCMKFKERICSSLGIELDTNADELLHMSRGVSLLWKHLPPDRLLHDVSDVAGLQFQTSLPDSGLAPYLLVSLGSALTMVEVHEDGSVSGLVGGSSQGGLTLLGLGALLTGANNYTDLMELAAKGDRRNIDLLVKDTAGADYSSSSVSSESMVSSFGKVAKMRGACPDAHFDNKDVACSLLYCVTDHVAAHAYLVAKCQKISQVVFCGSYLGNNPRIIRQIKTKLSNCSIYLKHKVSPVFMRHEGYLGAIGLLSREASEPDNTG